MTLAKEAGPVSTKEATEIAGRFNASHWRERCGGHETARYSIPADPRRDDDIRLGAFIEHVEALVSLAEDVVADGITGNRIAELRVAILNLRGRS